MKRIVALALAFAVSVMLISCGAYGAQGTDGTTASSATSATSATTFPSVTPGDELAEPYVDIDFEGGTVTDKKGRMSFEIKAWGSASPAFAEDTCVTFLGNTVMLPALNIKNAGTWVKCVFNDMANDVEMNEFVADAGGISIEAFYLDNSSTGQNRGIVCCTESIGGDARRSGWGIAETANGAPYFITGHTQQNVYSSVEAMVASDTELVHVVAVYDAVSCRNSIYVNGKLITSAPAGGAFTAANKTEATEGFNMGNMFYIGADPTAMESKKNKDGCDFASDNLIVTDVKIYDKALSDSEVSAIFSNAAQIFKQ